MKTLILTALVIFAVYLFFRSSAAVTKCLAAILFVLRRSKNAVNVHVRSCTGWAKHTLRLQEGRMYEFHLDTQDFNGEIAVFLLDDNKQELLRLTPYFPSGNVMLSGSARCCVRWEFKHASGKFALGWQEV